ncbi:sigma-54 interaction domain-containing protein [Desulfosporosinus metallidurans]|uniref:Transcriptional regulator BkdR of isoleucine and valine catabolism operon n=1 Tax=Desulfosporosinus metallidurans TaxID=1888891 RepID=A0A1Q8QET0_9FIRM|nr:sigma-54-dependent Fis family transcriptional regulator [Desulfosporosinus metallidurans]OLN25857.1 Transcriptional regulator BkdR of isoleucine and valine catabolism operon [Desulfosporosinus metallidurans]
MGDAVWQGEFTEIFREVLESVHNGVIVIDIEGTIMFLNPAAERIFNCQAEKLLGQHIYSLVPNSALFAVAKSGVPLLSDKEKLGDKILISNRTPIVWRQKIIGAVSVFQDITDLENVCEELHTTQKLKATLEAVVENPHEGLVVVDEHCHVVMMNQFYLDVVGRSLEEVIGKHILEITPGSQLPETVRTGNPQFAELWKVRDREFIMMRVPIKNNGKIIGAIGKTLFKDMVIAKVFAKKLIQLENDLDYYKEEFRKIHVSDYTFDDIIGVSASLTKAKNLAARAAQSSSTVLITGESGTGKEIFANAIHNSGPRRKGPFIKINCAAVPEQLLESEFFGYNEGAFTGARKGGKPGKFELANRGTIFLDEASDMSLSMQAKLLRVIQDREVERIGGTQPIRVDVRIIAASNRDLQQLVKENKFRLDLFYRINVISLELPPLRERSDDTEPLANQLIAKLNRDLRKQIKGISPQAMEVLKSYNWPGNVRELGNILERIINFCTDDYINLEHLPAQLMREKGLKNYGDGPYTLRQGLIEAEKNIILNALHVAKGNKMQAARALGIHRSVLYRKLAQYNLPE